MSEVDNRDEAQVPRFTDLRWVRGDGGEVGIEKVPLTTIGDDDGRPWRQSIHMRTAQLWAKRSLCKRLRVGCVITTHNMRRVLSIGYNGPARSLPHDRCRVDAEGNCGCLHAEDNAIAMCDSTIPDKVIFVTVAPCEQCASRIINAGTTTLWYIDKYRSDVGLELLKDARITVVKMEARHFVGL
jgi:dCMP deaminase